MIVETSLRKVSDVLDQVLYILIRLPVETRLRIFGFTFRPHSHVYLEHLFRAQDWIYTPGLRLGADNFYPRLLSRIPKQYRDEAQAVAYRQTLFKATSMDQIIRFNGMMGQIGRDNLEALRIDWTETYEINFDWINSLDTVDAHAIEAFTYLGEWKRLRLLEVDFNGYAFILAYANHRHRRLKDYDDPVTGPQFIERLPWGTNVTLPNGDLSQTDRMDRGEHAALLGDSKLLWKLDTDTFVYPLRPAIAECDPVLTKLKDIRGIKWLSVRTMGKCSNSSEGQEMERWFADEMTKPREKAGKVNSDGNSFRPS